jgi:effector-binding domain-containing protein
MSCFRPAAPLWLTLLLGLAVAPAIAQKAEVPDKPPIETMPPAATPIPAPDAPSPLQSGDAFGEEIMLPERTIIYLQSQTNWDSALETLIESFNSLEQYMDKHGLKPDGLPMTIYTQTDNTGFHFRAALPIAEAPKDEPKGDIAVGPAPSGKALKFVHRGSYNALDTSYEAITEYLDDKGLDAKEVFVEEYASGPLRADSDNLVINIYVPVR